MILLRRSINIFAFSTNIYITNISVSKYNIIAINYFYLINSIFLMVGKALAVI